jgi:hypothetical protein
MREQYVEIAGEEMRRELTPSTWFHVVVLVVVQLILAVETGPNRPGVASKMTSNCRNWSRVTIGLVGARLLRTSDWQPYPHPLTQLIRSEILKQTRACSVI